MTITKKIVEELKKQDLTSIEISKKVNVNMDNIVVYLNRLVNNNTIKRITNKKPFVYSVERINNLDTQILLKMIPKFIEFCIKLDNTNEIEDKRLEELIKQCL